MKQNVILLAFVVIFSITYCYGQKVTKSAHGAIIDASAIPHTTVKKARGTNGTNEKQGTNTIDNISSRVSDEKVYRKFEVYKEDYHIMVDWLSGINVCKNMTVDGGGWRVPTLRESLLILILMPELEKIEGFRRLANNGNYSSYITATEFLDEGLFPSSATFFSSVTYHGNTIYAGVGKSSDYFLRCIRDL